MNNGTIQSIDNPRYRPTGLKQGEMQMYMVDKRSDQDGTGGTMRRVLQGLQGWVCNLLGKQIFIGDGDNDTIQIGAHKDSRVKPRGGQTVAPVPDSSLQITKPWRKTFLTYISTSTKEVK